MEQKVRRPNGHRRQDARRVEFRLLGPFELLIDEQAVDIGPPKLRVLLAVLLLHVGRPVLVEQLAELLWGDEQPHSPRRGAQLYVTRLRGILAKLAPEVAIDSYPSSYRLNVHQDQIDLCRFTKYLRRAAEAAEHGNLDGEATALTDALAQWRGEPLAGIPSDRLQQEFAPHLREQWLQAAERRFDVELRRGRHAELIGDLLVWTGRHPLRERLWVQLMTALQRSGRRSDALDAYHTVRRCLADELGVDPGEDLRNLYAQVLADGPQLAAGSLASVPPVPRQLPAGVLGFVGRVEELVQLDGLLSNQHRRSTSTTVGVIAGTAGIGKTALAAHWARTVADRFPDGQLWVSLRGFDTGHAVTADQALTRFLRALRVPETEIPLDVEDKVGLYRSLMDGRRMLVVLDNAASSTQVLPLLPGAPGSVVLITSRSKLSGLVATAAAQQLVLDLMTHTEACQLLARRVDADRVLAEPAPVREIIDLCARLPLALSIVATRAAACPSFALDALAADLRAAHGTLDAFAGSDSATEVRAAFSWSYRSVSSAAGRLFRLLGLHPGPDLAIAAVASLAGLSIAQTRPLLVELTDAHLVTETTPGRYAFHDLMRAYATELGLTEDSTSARQEAQRRMIDHYLHTAHGAAETLPATESIGPVPAAVSPGVKVEDFKDHRQALLWFTAEHHVLLAMVELAAKSRLPVHAQRLAWALIEHFFRHGAWHDGICALQVALDTTVRSRACVEQARLHRGLARAYARLGQMEAAVAHGRFALDLSEELGDDVGLAWSHRVFGVVLEVQGRLREALDHDLRALELFQKVRDRAGEARALNAIGWSYGLLGEYEQALGFCERALTLLTDLGDRQGQAAAWNSLGYAQHRLRRDRRAVRCYRKSLDILRDIGALYNEAETLIVLGDVHETAGHLKAARATRGRALEILTELGHHETEVVRTNLRNLGSAEPGISTEPRSIREFDGQTVVTLAAGSY